MHSNNVLHRDLKPDNIFLGLQGKIKIGDFGISKIFDSVKKNTISVIGTPYYVSPEILKEEGYSYKSDIWALGCIIYYMFKGFNPFEDET